MINLRSDFFTREDAHGVSIGAACDLIFGDEWYTWEPRTTREELALHGFTVSEINSQKLSAYIVAKTTIGPWADLEIFENVGQAFNNNFTNFQLRQPLSAAECAVTVESLRQCRIVTFTEGVKKYIAACGARDELLYLPDPLTFAMKYLCPQYYYCEEHGGIELDDLIDGHCDLCAGRYEEGELIDAPLPELQGRGTHIKSLSLYDYSRIANKYNSIISVDIDTVQLELNETDQQVAKLLDVNSYMKKRRTQMQLQLQEVRNVRR